MRNPTWWQQVVDQVLTYQRANPANLPGAVFAVETEQDGRLVTSIGDRWTDPTICEIGSITKAFTGTAVLLALEEHDLLDVDTPVWRLPGMDLYADDPVKREIRVRHLLQHTTGLPNTQPYSMSPRSPCNDPGGPSTCCPDPSLDLGPTAPWTCFPGGTNECISTDGRCQPARTLSLEKVSGHFMRFYAPAPEHPLGQQYSYSPLNYVVAARIVEELTGRSLNIYLKEKLFIPLGMRDAFFIAQKTGDPLVDARLDDGVAESQRARIADLTLITRDGQMPSEVAPGPDGRWDKFRRGWRFVYPDGGMYATVNDLLTFLGMLRNGGLRDSRRILSPAIVSLLVDDQGFGHTMGFGHRGRPTPYGQGSGTLEHLGGKMCYLWYDPRAGKPLVGVFLSQRLPNIGANANIAVGLKVIFRVFVSAVNAGLFGFRPAEPPPRP